MVLKMETYQLHKLQLTTNSVLLATQPGHSWLQPLKNSHLNSTTQD
ncbi:hypothetical protein 20Sep418_00019 [Pseudomonas phage 20Sep418]|uniref:Uncharacterized protein n=7 Tax=Pakpunavirus TaxID=1921407 RepID=A0A9E6U5P9_9CAUD|nr:hypothetical protein QE325_gp082 [Pseudomonas phage pPA-3099-2aT.2]YP_010763323.1 hypothetical protein QE329_gp179 [Pseudomonas phage PhL_UNISO_PA-DSM_ph0034]YP_010763650.1 hypothetical protein QE331_gp186 [Pseudomonas phage 20Sep416]YP_010765116.1 hypothetical protein QE347_gp008 [Pseudomonas phage vB_Paer_Ps12]YP_010765304.1 hypothetical protein QE348_gp008 [Pseudomonas phage vB_Paer_PsIn]YP_010765501.1 hypothetical protein QE349_gp008 [Pseudomonas phage vB_Paer_PsCh]UOL47652.1 hypotheti